jgi:uncharacterized protein YbjT (DUF2867 family)
MAEVKMLGEILIIGGHGKTGARVNSRLLSRGIATRPVSRSTAIPFDWERGDTWSGALEGTSRAYVTYHPDIAAPKAADAIGAFGQLAKAAGLSQVVLLSGRGEPNAERAEEALKASGIDWTIIRSSWFNQNFSEGYLIDGVLSGSILLPAPPVPEPFVDADDIADVVTATLTDERHVGRIYELTGPRAITFAEATAHIAAATGREIKYQQISAEHFAFGMRQAQVPEDIISLLNALFDEVLDGRNSKVMQGVEQVLGRPARDFADFARDAAAGGAWAAK